MSTTRVKIKEELQASIRLSTYGLPVCEIQLFANNFYVFDFSQYAISEIRNLEPM